MKSSNQKTDHLLRFATLGCFAVAAFFGYRAFQPEVPNVLPTATAEIPADRAVSFQPANEAFHAATASTLVTRSIEEIRLGQRVVGTNPLREQTQPASGIDAATWRTVRLNMQHGVEYDLAFLRPLSWLQSENAEIGSNIHLTMHEMGLNGPAKVIAIDPCPPIEPDDGTGRNVVTGTMAHPGANILYLDITGPEEPLGVTDTHPIWSETRQDFVVAGKLEVGEQFRTLTGESVTLQRITPHRGPPEMVFNLEVDGEHVYSVAGSGVLVHNTCPDGLPLTGRPHGGTAHDEVIDTVLREVQSDGASQIRKNQALVDALGENKLSDVRPDGQWTENGVKHILQVVDSNPVTHEELFKQLDPDAIIEILHLR